jgi:hypothetical protein
LPDEFNPPFISLYLRKAPPSRTPVEFGIGNSDCGLKKEDHLFYESLARDRKEKVPLRAGRRKHRRDIAFHNLSLLAFRKAQRGREKIGSEEKRTPPPQPRRDMRLRIASKMTFLPGP